MATLTASYIYAEREKDHIPLSADIVEAISKIKLGFVPEPRRPVPAKKKDSDQDMNWRSNVLVDMVRKVQEKDDPDYSEVLSFINKLAKSTYDKLMGQLFEKIEKRDAMFRLRITTLLFESALKMGGIEIRKPGMVSNTGFMADAYRDIIGKYPDAKEDLETQTAMFETLYDSSKVIEFPSSTDPGFDEAVNAWGKQKRLKRGFAVYVSELYARDLVSEEKMNGYVKMVLDDLKESVRRTKTNDRVQDEKNDEHINALCSFIESVAPKCKFHRQIGEILALPVSETPSLSFRFKFMLERAQKTCKDLPR